MTVPGPVARTDRFPGPGRLNQCITPASARSGIAECVYRRRVRSRQFQSSPSGSLGGSNPTTETTQTGSPAHTGVPTVVIGEIAHPKFSMRLGRFSASTKLAVCAFVSLGYSGNDNHLVGIHDCVNQPIAIDPDAVSSLGRVFYRLQPGGLGSSARLLSTIMILAWSLRGSRTIVFCTRRLTLTP